MTRRIFAVLLLAGVLWTLPVFSLFRGNVYAGTSSVRFDETDVLEDLQSAEGFSIEDYPFRETGSPQILNFVEYCYSFRANQRKNYGLYLYIYNPQGLDFDTESPLNRAQIAVAYDTEGLPTEYEKFELCFCSRSAAKDLEGLFYKFRIVDRKSDIDGKRIGERVNSLKRRYDLSGFELVIRGETTAREYKAGGTYTFTGYSAGYGADVNAADTLQSEVTDLETVSLTLHHATYLSQASDSKYNQLHSVYFSVPSATIARYGENLQAIKAEWYEYRTELIAVLAPDWEAKFRDQIGKLPGDVTCSEYMVWDPSKSHDVYGRWYFNYKESSPLYWLLPNAKATEANTYIPAEDLLGYMQNYSASFRKGKINGKYSADLFEDGGDGQEHKKTVRICAGDKFNLLSEKQNSFQAFMNRITGRPDSYPDLQIEKAIEPLKNVNFVQSDVMLSSALYVNEPEVYRLRDYCQKEVALGNYPYLFRFAVRDFETAKLETNFQNLAIGWRSDHIGFGAKESAFLDFDVIELEFFKDGKYYVLPVVASPIDAIGGLISPNDSGCGNLGMIFGLLLLLLLLILLAPILPYVFRFLGWLICLPFRAIGGIVKACKRKKKEEQDREQKKTVH